MKKNIKATMKITDAQYKEHKIFGEIEICKDFYESLSFSTMHWVSVGTTALNLDTYVFSSIKGTLDSLGQILLNGRINDAYAMLRKYHDSAIINAYEVAYLDDHTNLENFINAKIDSWVKGREKLPEYNIMKQYLQNHQSLSAMNNLIQADDRYKKIRQRCNDHMHYNLFYYMMANDNEIYLKNRLVFLDQLSKDLKDIFVLHFAYLFTLRQHYMAASDYLDALDCNMTPEEGSQYFVAPFIQEVFDVIVKANRKDISDKMIEDTSMQLK